LDNNFIDGFKSTAESSKSSTYSYTIDDIEKFFASDNGQNEEHSLEDNICRPLIGQQSNKPFFYYCSEHPNLENIYLKSIEDHIRLKDPQRHKAKLLEMMQKGEHMESMKPRTKIEI
jgi:hypothetical protein